MSSEEFKDLNTRLQQVELHMANIPARFSPGGGASVKIKPFKLFNSAFSEIKRATGKGVTYDSVLKEWNENEKVAIFDTSAMNGYGFPDDIVWATKSGSTWILTGGHVECTAILQDDLESGKFVLAKVYKRIPDNAKHTLTCSGTPTDGTFKLTWMTATTFPIKFDVDNELLEDIIWAQLHIRVSVTGGPLDEGEPFTIEFMDRWAEQEQDLMTIDNSALVGGTITAAVENEGSDEATLQETSNQILAHEILGITSTDEVQTITTTVAGVPGDTFTLKFQGQTTTDIPYNATKDQIKNALVALSILNNDQNNYIVEDGPLDINPVRITFTGEFGNEPFDLMILTPTGTFEGEVEREASGGKLVKYTKVHCKYDAMMNGWFVSSTACGA